MRLRSLLFVPGDRPDRMVKAATSGADALILDLEDSVSLANKAHARTAVAAFLVELRSLPLFVRVNSLDSGLIADDLATILSHPPDALVLPKAEGAPSIDALVQLIGKRDIPILPIATETPAAVFALGSFAAVGARLCGLTWGAEDLPAAIGASASRDGDGQLTPPYEMVRSLALFAAHAAGVPAIETVFPDFNDTAALENTVVRARRDGFTGMMAIHPAQIATINAGFTPSEAEIARARAIVSAFSVHEGAGALQLDGKMIDAPHLKQARALLARLD